MMDLFSVKDKVVLITGSTRGLGLSFAKGFAQAGAKVILNGRDPIQVQQVVQSLEGTTFGYAFDVCDKTAVAEAVDKIEAEVGPIDVLVNNAGIQRRGPLEELTMEDWETVIDVNLNSVFYISQCVFKYMKTRRKGKIINITSLNAEKARPSIGNYSAAKGGLKMLTKSMATEWGPYNIQTNAIGPGYFITDLTQKLVDDPEFDKWVKSEVPLQKWGKPEELIGTAIYLASDASNYVNGHTVYVDGGWQASL
ncbi:glucose 1-dehydrogenase [Bacillus luteolus]|uniref:Glucose 1-dehydrogenase n=1 Tax=Litchfieldia luteola TaxID=682179 RepID=A0ABR9QEH3_9BACI|nr:glucose 1-dehydrogenase [Cytobacillus luteolus]MBE4906887.1 glucose 1-dehydrogenase [Cytobacillus luteolus]MBP1940458.1 gluconate 5-dehydrogenase [Cytobacillus luteolus]